jgi:DNA-binding transcriptional MocR family regulator
MFSRLDSSECDMPLFRQLADHVIALIARGRLRPGDRLPPQREIAREAGVNLSTVTRAFALLQEEGHVVSRPGRGSIIAERARAHDSRTDADEAADFIDLSVTRPATDAWLRACQQLLPGLPQDSRFAQTADVLPAEGPEWARLAMADWLAPLLGLHLPERMILSGGAQHGLSCVLAAIARPGDVVLTDEIGYQGIAALCASLHLELRPVPMDREGMCPDALDRLCGQARPVAVFLNPTLHNPLTLTLTAERRATLAAVVRRYATRIIEDDVYRPLMPDAPRAFVCDHDDITVYITSLSKCAAPGARCGVILAPEALVVDIANMLRVSCWSMPPLMALIVSRLIESGRLASIIDEQRLELQFRYAELARLFRPDELVGVPGAPHAWLKLPAPWRGEDFVRAARQAGVGLLPGAAFTVSRESSPPDAVRISLSAAGSLARLQRAAHILRRLMDRRPALANLSA